MSTGGSRPGKGDIQKMVERQMRNWELARAQRVEPPPATGTDPVQEFVTVSRTVASGGGRVGRLLGERLGWPVYDRELLQSMADDDHLRARIYENLDEREASWLEETVRWMVRGDLKREDYFCRLSETVLAMARRQKAVFLGRAVDCIFPAEKGLRVRITAPLEKRIAEMARRLNCDESAARTELERIDKERDEFRRTYFGTTRREAVDFDLTLNLSRFEAEQAVEVILTALRQRKIIT